MKQQKPIQEQAAADRSTEEIHRERARERFFETVREIQQANKDVDPDRVLADVTAAVEAVRKEEYERKTTRRP